MQAQELGLTSAFEGRADTSQDRPSPHAWPVLLPSSLLLLRSPLQAFGMSGVVVHSHNHSISEAGAGGS